ncbi:hypothetical protein SAMN05216553_101596 [Lentzea fradiae]|uniref:Uncharacterized protein n=1 Tax=Lentzea fradiae TaxID=200378 RepID=A0A1G7L099_9PSEU|nr:hypothetical protein [Lentzea fradiae]SDF42895.1 hypothetical protein SAMN05216553_101596 [Lentzea fradiae]
MKIRESAVAVAAVVAALALVIGTAQGAVGPQDSGSTSAMPGKPGTGSDGEGGGSA